MRAPRFSALPATAAAMTAAMETAETAAGAAAVEPAAEARRSADGVGPRGADMTETAETAGMHARIDAGMHPGLHARVHAGMDP